MKTNMVLSLSDISLSFWDNSGTESFIFEELNLDIYAGRIYRLSGENGSGKSSLVKVIKGIYRPNAGEVILKPDVKIFSPDFENLPKDITVKDYVSFYSTDSSHLIDLLSLKNILKLKISSLSTGEKQRLALSPLFVDNYDLIIFDESFKYIDEAKRILITKAIMATTNGSAIIYIEHEMEDLFQASDLLEIKDKKIQHIVIEEEVEIKQKEPKLNRRKGHHFWHLFLSHRLAYIGFVISILFFQVAPMALYTNFSARASKDLTVLTMSDKGKRISDEVKEELFGFERVGYSMEYNYYTRLSIDPSLDDKSCVVYGPNNILHVVGGYLSFSSIVILNGSMSNRDPILRIVAVKKKEARDISYAVSKKNYIIMRQIEMLERRFYIRRPPFWDLQLIVSDKSNFPLSCPLNCNPKKDVVFVDKNYGDQIKRYNVQLFNHEVSDDCSIYIRTDFIASVVDDGSFVSLLVNDKKGYKNLKAIAKKHGLNIFTNYAMKSNQTQLEISLTLGIMSLAILINIILYIYVQSLEKKKFETLLDFKVERSRYILATLGILVISLITTLVFMPFLQAVALLNLGIYVIICSGYLSFKWIKKLHKIA